MNDLGDDMINKVKNVPKIRFSGYTHAWEKRRLGEVAQIIMGQSPASANYTDNPADHILVQGNADMKNGRVFPRVWTTQITKRAEKGDLILSVRAPVGDVGKTDYDVVLGRGVAAIRGNEFLFQTLTKMKQDGYWSRLSAGSTFESINSDAIRDSYVDVPSKEEQTKIGNFFQVLDNLLALHQRKYNKLKDLKKGYLQKMFPKGNGEIPEIRFVEFDGEWENKKLRELLKERNDQISENEDYLLMSFVAYHGVVPKGERYDRSALVLTDSKKYKKTELGDFIYSSNNLETGSIGFNNTGSALISPVYSIFYSTKNADSRFIGLMASQKYFIYQMIRFRQGVVYGQYRIHESDFLTIIVNIPSKKEQLKIIDFFMNLDQQITQQESKLKHIKQLKQAYLQNMFV